MNHKIKQCFGLEGISGEKFSDVLGEPPMLQFVSIDPGPVTRCIWNDLSSVFFRPSLQAFIYTDMPYLL